MRAEIEEKFIAKGVSQPDIPAQELVEIDGNAEQKPIVGAIGGVLGQIILVLNSMEKNFNR